MHLSPKRRSFLLAFAGVAFLLSVPFAPFAQDGEPPPVPFAPQHAWLAKNVGEWRASCRWFAPDGSVMEFEGTERSHMACGGLWLVSDFEADFMGAPFAGHSITGYDPAARSLKGVWVDSMSTRMLKLEGSLTEDVCVLMTTGIDPETGAEYPEKHVTRFTGPDERLYRMLRVDGDAEIPLMEITYSRSGK